MNLFRVLVKVSGLTLISRMLGFVRDAIMARMFGAGLDADAFIVAARIPNLLRRMFAEGAFSQAFVPVLAEYKNRRGEAETRSLIDKTATLLSLILFAVTVVGILAAPVIVYVTAPGFRVEGGKFALTVNMLRIMFPYILFISLTSLASGVLNTWSRFAIPAVTPALLNIAYIVAALGFAGYFDPPIMVLAWAVFVGGILQLGLQLIALARMGLLPRWRSPWGDQGVKRILKLMLPAIFGVSVAQISLVLNTIFASYLQTGSVSWLYYADRLMEFPAGLLGVALGTILLPSLAKTYSDNDPSEFSRLLDWGLRMTLLLAAPAAVALALLAVPLISTLFQQGAFGAIDVDMTRRALLAYSLGLVGLILVKVLAPGFYARQNVATPVRIAVFTLVLTQLLNLVLVGPFAHAGLALAIGLAACLNAGLLYWQLRRQKIFTPQPGWAVFTIKLAFGLVAMGLALWAIDRPMVWWVAASGAERMLWLTLLVVVGAMTYFAAVFALGFRVRDFVRRTR